jgi:HlyD family secretion protein
MSEINSTVSSFVVAMLLAGAVCAFGPGRPLITVSAVSSAVAAEGAPGDKVAAKWDASATGRVEPKGGQILIGTQQPGRVADVAVALNDTVQAGDLLVRLEEDDLMTRMMAASTEVQVRERERDEEVPRGLQLERRQAEDSVASAERALFRARLEFDEKAFKARGTPVSAGSEVDKARFAITAAKEQLANSRSSLARVVSKTGMPFATRLESSLASARAELSLSEAAVERARIRAPSDGTVLSVHAKYGELVAPSPDAPLLVIGDLRSLRVKAEVDERDATKVRAGQKVIVKGDAFPDKEFTGTVSTVSQTLGSPKIATRGVRRPNDIEVMEAMVQLDGNPPLLTGMRVDVFFKSEGSAAVATPAKTN